jgi:hypothetical protein
VPVNISCDCLMYGFWRKLKPPEERDRGAQ